MVSSEDKCSILYRKNKYKIIQASLDKISDPIDIGIEYIPDDIDYEVVDFLRIMIDNYECICLDRVFSTWISGT